MSAKAIERAMYVGTGVLAAIIVAVLVLSPLEAIWTAAIIFGVAAAALGGETIWLRSRRRDQPGSARPSSA